MQLKFQPLKDILGIRTTDKRDVPYVRESLKRAGLYIAKEKDIEHLSKIAEDAYADYPLHNWFTSGEYDKDASRLIMQITLKAMIKDAVVYADDEEMKGFAVWMPPGFSGIRPVPFPLNDWISLVSHSGIGLVRKLLIYEDYAMGLKKKYTGNKDWYLYNISIKRSEHGKGIASKLMRPMLQFLDERQLLAYLETNNESNVGLYLHYGFDLMEEGVIPNSTITHYAMIRRPDP